MNRTPSQCLFLEFSHNTIQKEILVEMVLG